MATKSIEEKVEDHFKSELKQNDITYYCKTEYINSAIDRALANAPSKSGGSGNNYPDIKVLVQSGNNRVIPVMIEVKGSKGKLVKFDSKNQIELKSKNDKNTAIVNYAVNGAIHYANAILDEGTYHEVLAVGCNGYEEKGKITYEIAVYYLSEDYARVPICIETYTDSLSFLNVKNLKKLFEQLDLAGLTDEQREELQKAKHVELEKAVKAIHQKIYEDHEFKTALETNDKLFLFSGLIMASLPIEGSSDLLVKDLKGNTTTNHDGKIILDRIDEFLSSKKSTLEKKEMVIRHLTQVFIENEDLWSPINNESLIKRYYRDVVETILPILKLRINVDFTGIILTSLKDWMKLENDRNNDVVLTPRFVTKLMAKLAQTNMNSFVWDTAMGSGGFLISAMELMIEDVKKRVPTYQEQESKIQHIKSNQLLGIEILPNIFILAVINMILTGDGSSNVRLGNGLKYEAPTPSGNFPYDVFLLNPPYSAPGKGFEFVEKALSMMSKGYGCVLIQENAGSGNGLPYTKEILKRNSLVASIHMSDLFKGKASVQTAIYLFKVNQPHDPQGLVTFIDFSNDGYARQNRRRSSEEVNLRDVDNAQARYKEIEDIILGRKKDTNYYSEANGLVVKATISLNGDDWTFAQHKEVDLTPKLEDFKATVKDFLAWKVSQIIQQEDNLGKL